MTPIDYARIGGLRVAPELAEFVEREAIEESGLTADRFWAGVEDILAELMPTNRRLLAERDRLQAAIDEWHLTRSGQPWDSGAYRSHLEEIGYLLPEPSDVTVVTTGVDAEIADVAGPQLVVPITNARYSLNAANARWGSLYDAFYGTDALPGTRTSGGYDEKRGAMVISKVRALLDEFYPLQSGTHSNASEYRVERGALVVQVPTGPVGLKDAAAFRGFRGNADHPDAVLLRHHGLHWEVRFDPASSVGSRDHADISDVIAEAALTTIIDFEDSVATVDASDKVACYRNWLGLNRGDLSVTFQKNGTPVTRGLADDRHYTAPDGTPRVLSGRSLLFVRTVGHHMMTDMVLDKNGNRVGEGILDAVITGLCALPGIAATNPRRNSATGSIYIVKPKMHGPEEVAFTVGIFERVERLLGLPHDTLKLGLMDEERRTSVNLKAALAEATTRLVFINTGFLDRSGDEIHTSMQAGPIARKAELRTLPWMLAYEEQNVAIGLEVGLHGRAQIGKGMWAAPDQLRAMLEQKIAHPASGATTAWVPSPTAATLHSLHYLQIDVHARQDELSGARRDLLGRLLTVPLGDPSLWDHGARQEELDNNVQSLLGYVVRWVNQGIGCSKVPDIHNVGLMEDRATLRISSQLLANWLRHGVVSEGQVQESLERIAAVVDAQNANEPDYQPMAPGLDDSIAFRAACDLIFKGAQQPNGYTEPILTARRRELKARLVRERPSRE